MDIAAWLRGLGLEEYAPAFRDNGIDAEVLPDLTEAHLATLGLPLGPRLKLLKAIAALREGAVPSHDEPAAAVPTPVAAPRCRGRATAADCDVLRPRRLDGAVGAP
jgi:hypothetical protein